MARRIRDLYARATASPTYQPDEADLADVRVFGLDVPIRASIAVIATTAVIVVDQLQLLVPAGTPGDVQPFVDLRKWPPGYISTRCENVLWADYFW